MKKILLSLVLSCFTATTVFAFGNADSNNNCTIGAPLFRNTLYGVGLGALIGGLVVLARHQSGGDHIVATMATSSLIGAGAGLTVGVVEVILSQECRPQSLSMKRGGSLVPFIGHLDPRDTLKNELFANGPGGNKREKRIGGGIQFIYPL